MSKVEVKLNLAGINTLMKSPEMQKHLEKAGAAVAQHASALADGEQFESSVHTASFVSIANVWPVSYKAIRKNNQENTLLKAVGEVGLYLSKDAARNG